MSKSKMTKVCSWQLTYYKIDTETGDALCDDDGNDIEINIPDEDCSSLVESVDPDDLVEEV